MKRTFRLENTDNGNVAYVTACCRKDAHEMGQRFWPGITVEVCTELEYYDRETFREHHNQIMDFLEGVSEAIPDSNYTNALRCLESVKQRIQELEVYFENQLASVNAGEGSVG